MLTRVCRLYGQNDIRIETDEVLAPEAGEVLVAIGAGGICGSDLHYYQDGGFGPIRVQEPIILGHEAAGTVVAVGAGVEGLTPGDRVAVNPSRPCGICHFCQAGLQQHCMAMRFNGSALRFPHEQGLFRDRMIVLASQCLKLTPTTSLAAAACAEPLAVCLHAANRAWDLAGKRVLVTGAGPIGVLCVAVAKLRGADEVVVTDLQDVPLQTAQQMGASRLVNVERMPEDLAPYSESKGQIDLAFECSAAPSAMRAAVAAVRPQGMIMQVGVAGDLPVPINVVVGKELSIAGTHRFHREYAEAVRMIDSGEINVAPVVTQQFSVEDAVDAFRVAGDRSRSVKVQLVFAE